jgi:tetratricopeptide (TPR) repeat protein
MDKHFQHALVLFDQRRYDLAEEKLRQSLLADPENAVAHALLADCLVERKQLEPATAEAREAIRLEPDLPLGHAALARVLLERNRFDEAEKAIQEAIRLEPRNPNHFAQLAAIRLNRRDWADALDAAEVGLILDPEHVGCTNLRAMALVKLGRQDEAGQTLAAALARDPEDAFSHANQGWALLHEGQRQKALEHFREALRLEPGLEFARAGIVEAMKSKNWIYALMLRYFLWMSRRSNRAQWAIVLGGYFGYQGLRELAREKPALSPYVTPLLIAYIVFALLTWLAGPLFNLLLRLDRFGRHALSRDQVVASNWVGGILGLALAGLLTWLVTPAQTIVNSLAILVGGYFGLLLLPTCGVFNCQAGWPRRMMALYTVGLAVTGLASLALLILRQEAWLPALQVFLWGCFLSGFVANFLMTQTPRC